MASLVVGGAGTKCSMGLAPSVLNVLPVNKTKVNTPAATVMDMAPLLNLASFGLCNSATNPAVIAATAAALGVHTPMPCVPVPTGPWSPGCPKLNLAGKKALTHTSTCNCAWNGVIEITTSGQGQVTIP